MSVKLIKENKAIFHMRVANPTNSYEKDLARRDGEEVIVYNIPKDYEITKVYFSDGKEYNVYGDELELID